MISDGAWKKAVDDNLGAAELQARRGQPAYPGRLRLI
jgi:hypothetical protein